MLKYCAVFSLWAGVGLGQQYLTYQAARLVIGQPTFTAQASGTSNSLIGSAAGIAFAGNTLFLVDANRFGLNPVNNRVLLYTNITQSMPQPMDPIAAYIARCAVCVGTPTVVLGQPDFTTSAPDISQTGMRIPTAVASDGQILAVADTDNNRVLIWNSIPTTNGQPADIVLGQTTFDAIGNVVVNASSFRAPQGLWVQSGKLYVADTQNNRVMIWDSIPTTNNQPADVVLGQPNFTTAPILDLTQNNLAASPTTMLNPVSVTSDGVHLFVTDLGFNRVLIWNKIPTQSTTPADVEVGQPDMLSSIVNNSFTYITQNNVMLEQAVLCPVATGTDSNSNPTYPYECAATLNFPRFALSDGTRLYIADGGNDRVLVFNTIPATNAASADEILGQPDGISDVVTSNSNSSANTATPNLVQSASNVTPTPTSLAWDGQNLYVADATDFRVLVFTPAAPNILSNGVRNSAIIQIYATGRIVITGSIAAGNTITLTLCPAVNGAAVASGTCTTTSTTAGVVSYTYTVLATDTFNSILVGMANLINAGAGDPNVIASPGLNFQFLNLTARVPGVAGNLISIATSTSSDASITSMAPTVTLVGGDTPTTVAPGTLLAVLGNNLADTTVSAPPDAAVLPLDLGGVEVYIDGIRSPLLYVSPTQINVQLSYQTIDTNSSSLYVRTQHADGTVTITDAVGVPIDLNVPGVFALPGVDPRQAIAYHGSSYSTGVISVDGIIQAGDIATVTIQNNTYSYTVQASDALATIRDALIVQISSNPLEVVTATATAADTRIFLRAKVRGPEGDNIMISATQTESTTPLPGATTAGVLMTATTPTLCCANVAGARITPDNPAIAGEVIYVYATGLGLVTPSTANAAIVDGAAYTYTLGNTATAEVSVQAGGVTADVISAGLVPGSVGIYEVLFQIDQSTVGDPNAQITVAQDIYISNVVTIPILRPIPPASTLVCCE